MNPLAGLVLCGGNSARMGEDKCFLRYHLHPQWEHLVRLLGPLCSKVVVSCRVQQLTKLSEALSSLPYPPLLAADLPEFAGHGPMSGLLTGFHRQPDHALLVVGCDYPFLTSNDLETIIGARSENVDAVCFAREKDEVDEPLVAVYEGTTVPMIKEYFRHGDYSLRRVLRQVRTRRLSLPTGDTLRSVDTPEEFHQAIKRIESPQ